MMCQSSSHHNCQFIFPIDPTTHVLPAIDHNIQCDPRSFLMGRGVSLECSYRTRRVHLRSLRASLFFFFHLVLIISFICRLPLLCLSSSLFHFLCSFHPHPFSLHLSLLFSPPLHPLCTYFPYSPSPFSLIPHFGLYSLSPSFNGAAFIHYPYLLFPLSLSISSIPLS